MFRCVVFAAVSTPKQATDEKFSIPNQIEQSQALIAARHWQEAHPPIVVPGHSRTELVSLTDAVREIPEIGELVELARLEKINLAVFYDFNRFRILIHQIGYTLAAFGCQMYSLNQPVDPVPPDQFVVKQNDSAIILQHVGAMTSDLQINTLRRNFRDNMPKRVTAQGLHFVSIPYGYAKPPGQEFNHKAVLIQVPDQCAILLRMKRWFLEDGFSGTQIARMLTEQGIPTPRGHTKWYAYVVLRMLTNPYYAGFVIHGLQRTRLNPLTGKRQREKLAKPVMAPGKHEPLWSEEDWRRMADRRKALSRNNGGVSKRTHLFSLLVYCDRCGSRMRVALSPRKDSAIIGYVCGSDECPKHEYIRQVVVVEGVREALQAFLDDGTFELPAPTADLDDEMKRLRALIKAIPEKRARYQRAMGNGLLSEDDLWLRLQELKAEEAEHEERLQALADQQLKAGFAANRRENLEQFMKTFDDLLAGRTVTFNARIRQVIEKIIIFERKVKRVRLR